MSEQRSISVSNSFLWEVTAISTRECRAACGLSVGRSGCLPSSFPSALRGRRHFYGDRRVTASVAKPRAPRRQSTASLELQTESILGCLAAEVKGHFNFPFGTYCGRSERFVLSSLSSPSSSSSACLLLSSSRLVSVPLPVWCPGFGWRWQQQLAVTEWRPSSTVKLEPLPQPPPAWQWYFQSKCKPGYKLKLQRHERLHIWFYFAAVQHFFFFFYYMHSLRELKEHLLCLDCLLRTRPSARA